MNRRIAHRVVSSRLPQNPWTLAAFLPTSATKLFRRLASKGTILGPGFWLLEGGGQQGQDVSASDRGAGVWLRAWCRDARRVALALSTLPPLFLYCTLATKRKNSKEAI
jgi:hypothetical protein